MPAAAGGTASDVAPARFITVFGGTAIHATGTLMNSPAHEVDVVAAYNAAHGAALSPDVGWTPTLFVRIDPTAAVPALVGLFAGAGHAQAPGEGGRGRAAVSAAGA